MPARKGRHSCFSVAVDLGDACLVLDFDGTILDTEEPSYQTWAELWMEHGHELTLASWQVRLGTRHELDAFAELEERVGRRLDPALRGLREVRKNQLTEANPLQPGILDWLDEADRLGIPIGVASSSPRDWVEGHLDRLGLRPRFLAVVCCDDDVPAKPDPTSYRLACEALGGSPARSVAVEDSPNGIAAAVGAGLYTVAVPHGLTADLDLSRADLVVDSLADLTLEATLVLAAKSARPSRELAARTAQDRRRATS